MSILLYKVKDNELSSCEETSLNSEYIYIIIDKHMKRPKIWVWSGAKAQAKDRYFAGVSATKIKSQERLYGSSIEVVEEGSEPEQFPTLDAAKFAEATPVEVAPAVVEPPGVPAEVAMAAVAPEVPAPAPEVSPPREVSVPPMQVQKDHVFNQRVKGLLKDVSQGLEGLKNKIDAFLADL